MRVGCLDVWRNLTCPSANHYGFCSGYEYRLGAVDAMGEEVDCSSKGQQQQLHRDGDLYSVAQVRCLILLSYTILSYTILPSYLFDLISTNGLMPYSSSCISILLLFLLPSFTSLYIYLNLSQSISIYLLNLLYCVYVLGVLYVLQPLRTIL